MSYCVSSMTCKTYFTAAENDGDVYQCITKASLFLMMQLCLQYIDNISDISAKFGGNALDYSHELQCNSLVHQKILSVLKYKGKIQRLRSTTFCLKIPSRNVLRHVKVLCLENNVYLI